MQGNALFIAGVVFAIVLAILPIRFFIRMVHKTGISFGMTVCILLAAILAVPFAMNFAAHAVSRVLHN